MQGLVLTAPAVDNKRDLPLRVLELLRPVLMRLIPGVRMVPSIPLAKTTPRADVVRSCPLPVNHKRDISCCLQPFYAEANSANAHSPSIPLAKTTP